MALAETEQGKAQKPDLTGIKEMRMVGKALGELNSDEVRNLSPEERQELIGGILVAAQKEYINKKFFLKARQLEPIIAAFKDGVVAFDELLQATMPERATEKSGGQGILGKVRNLFGR